MEVEEVTAGPAALRTDGDQVKKGAVLVLGAILGEEALQGGLGQMVVLQADSYSF